MSELINLIDFIRKEFNKSLNTFSIPKDPKYLYDPIKYSLKSKGKRFRPIIVHLSGRNFKCDPDDLMKVSLGLELLHNFTLVHDDIMDSDDTRRNMPTVHKKYDVPSAILAGDGIFTISQLILGTIQNNSNYLLQKYNEMVLEICEGQALDKQFEGEDKLNLDDYIEMVKKKTGALLGACLSLPAIISNENSEKVNELYDAGKSLGVGFQIHDDIFEIFGEESVIGKSLGSDISSNKNTAIAIVAKERNKVDWSNLTNQFDGKDLYKIRKFLEENNVKTKVENIADSYFSSAFKSLKNLEIDEKNELYGFFKMIQERSY
jgi:geranylgeranyl pyrophosphate synthase